MDKPTDAYEDVGMQVLSVVQKLALNPSTSEEQLRSSLIDLLNLAEKDMQMIDALKRQIVNLRQLATAYKELLPETL